MSFTWRAYLTEGLLPTSWQDDEWSVAWVGAFADRRDELEAATKAGVKARHPTYCPGDGLYLHGRARGDIRRAPDETDTSYVERLKDAFATWKWAGTDPGIINGFASLGYQTQTWVEPGAGWPDDWPDDGHVWIVSAYQWDCPDGDDSPDHSARAWVILDGYPEGILAGTQVIGDGSVIGDGKAIGINQTAAVVATWKWIIRKWKDAKATFPGMFVIVSDGGWEDMIGGGGVIGSGQVIGGEVLAIPVGE